MLSIRASFAVILSLSMILSGADAATARGNARGTVAVNNATTNTTQSIGNFAARAAKRTTVKAAPTANAGGNGDLAKRAAPNVTKNVSPESSANKPVAARAAASQKVIQTGQKVNTAATNSAVPQECQDAFYGCMDSFCMLDNASGGRCQCNDKIAELDKMLEDVLKMDKQSYAMATEGVERIQLGEAEEQIMSQAKSAAEKTAKTKTDTLAQWNSLYDQQDEPIQQTTSAGALDTFINKKGDALYKSAANMCLKSSSEECKQYSKMLQLVYAQRIRSDCIAYENALKQQQNQSKQKLQTAKKALRDAATEEFKDQNKYETAGECAVEFAKCMQTDDVCGSDYTGCVTLAAKENVRNNSNGTVAKQTKIKGTVSGSSITLAASTMETLLAKKEICMHVTKQCVNANKNDAVWNTFVRNAAPALKVAEETAESNLRMQCIPTLAECFKTACKSQIDPKDEQGSYDMCLSNPKTYKSLCKVQLEPCLEATGGTYDKPEDSSLWNGLIAALNSMKVDACTNQVRTCLTERCGDDFAGCVGLDTESIGKLCPVDKLTACVTDGRFSRNASDGKANTANVAEIREYVAEIGQGLALQIDNSLLATCQKALNESMMRVCGDTETCDALAKDDKLGTRSLEYNICAFRASDDGQSVVFGPCRKSLDQISDAEWNEWVWAGGVTGLMYWGLIDYDFDKNMFTTADDYLKEVKRQWTGMEDYEEQQTLKVFNAEIGNVQTMINNAITTIESDPIVQYCMTGREVQGFDASKKIGKKTKKVLNQETGKMEMEDASASRFPNLTDQVKRTIISYALRGARDNYDEKYDEVYQQLMTDQVAAAERTDRQKALETAKNTCDTWAANSVLPRSKTPTNIWMWVGIAFAVAVCVVSAVFSGGADLPGIAPLMLKMVGALGSSLKSVVSGIIATSVIAGTTAGALSVAGAVEEVGKNKSDTFAKPAHAELDQWNYRAKITTVFNAQTGECTKETIYRNCDKPVYSTGKCKGWGEEQTEVKTLKLL